ncbi:putative holin [Achromobacter xylosoxidans]|uniref:putative holin n=1 Tax=Alcaligenes xylosoxydans xylosoxydans TaxID=85698 RepID=UPI000B48B2BA|nr:putative holin [Achromobacter xylosoxidans]
MSRTFPDSPPLYRLLLPRLTTFIVLAILLALAIMIVSPAQLPVVVYKLSLISLAAVAAYWLDRALFPYARPDSYLVTDWRCGRAGMQPVDYPIVDGYMWPFVLATIRRAIIVAGVVIGVALGL